MLFRLALRNLIRNYRRSLLVLLTVAFGVGGLFAFHGFNAGIMNDYRTKVIHQQLGNGQLFTKGYREKVHPKPHEHWIENPAAIREAVRRLPYVDDVYPRVRFPALVSTGDGKSSLSAFGEGVEGAHEAKFFNALRLVSGKLLTDEADGAIVGKGLAESLGLKVGDKLTVLSQTVHGSLNGVDTRVVGIFVTGEANFDRSFFRIQLPLARTLLETDKAELLAVGLKDFADESDHWPELAAFVSKELPGLDAVSFEQIDKVNYENSVVWLDSQFHLILGIFVTIILLGVFNTTSLGILERTREVGIRRANGESLPSVRRLFLVEGLLLGAAGSVLGIAATTLLNATWLRKGILMPPPPGFEGYYYAFIKLQPQSAVVWALLGLACTVAATWVAARKVNRKSLIEMLSYV